MYSIKTLHNVLSHSHWGLGNGRLLSLLLSAHRVLLYVYFLIIIVALLNQSIKGNLINKEASLEKSAHFWPEFYILAQWPVTAKSFPLTSTTIVIVCKLSNVR